MTYYRYWRVMIEVELMDDALAKCKGTENSKRKGRCDSPRAVGIEKAVQAL
jgi:hypothetical protein